MDKLTAKKLVMVRNIIIVLELLSHLLYGC